jgi:hypothetical protein
MGRRVSGVALHRPSRRERDGACSMLVEVSLMHVAGSRPMSMLWRCTTRSVRRVLSLGTGL